MDFINDTPFEADMMRTVISTDDEKTTLMAVVVLKVTYKIGTDGSLSIDEDQIPLSYLEEKTELGTLPTDFACQKPGIDFMILGKAYAPRGRPVKKMRVTLKVGDTEKSLIIFGDRKWVKMDDKVLLAGPALFTQMSLTYENAYGGKAKALDYEIPNPYNPYGKGYVLEEKHIHGLFLPNIENPENLIKSWQDQPIPAGFFPVPVSSMFTVDRGIEADPEKKQQKVKPDVFQSAHPDLVFSGIDPGTGIQIEGMTPDSPVSFNMPDLTAKVSVRLGDKTYGPPGTVDTICVFCEERRFFLIHRTPFKYGFIPEQKRKTRIYIEKTGV